MLGPLAGVVALSPSSRRAWIEIRSATTKMGFTWSPSSRRAWIEITHRSRSGRPDCVALLEEGVDRNDDELEARLVKEGSPSSRRAWIEIAQELQQLVQRQVALLAEGVDRNRQGKNVPECRNVALLAEGVDRNIIGDAGGDNAVSSPSSRRAWIEIS